MATFKVPEGKTFFESMGYNYVDLVKVIQKNGGDIPTSEFITASENFLKLFSAINATGFGAVSSDMSGNIKKIKTRLQQAPLDSTTLQDMVNNELKAKKKTASDGLVWYTRTLEFTSAAMSYSVAHPEVEMNTSFQESYKTTLYPHHNVGIMGGAKVMGFNVLLNLVPNRKDFYGPLGQGLPQFDEQAAAFLESISEIVEILKKFLAGKKI